MEVLSRLFARNWTLKLVAVGLAIMLWVVVRVEENDRLPMSGIPVAVEIQDPEWVLAADPDPDQVQVQFSGVRRELMGLSAQRPTLRVVLSDINSSDTSLALTREHVVLPEGTSAVVDEVVPGQLTLRLDRLETRQVGVIVPTVGSIDSALALMTDPTPTPATVRVRGPSRRLDALQRVPLEALDLSTLVASGPVALSIDTTAVPGLEVDRDEVAVQIDVEPRVARTFEAFPVPAPTGWVADPVAVNVTVRGAESLVDALERSVLELVVRVPAGGSDGESEYDVNVLGLPPLVDATVEPARVRIRSLSTLAPGS